MRQQPIHTILGHRELTAYIEVVGVYGDTVDESREARRHMEGCADDRGGPTAEPQFMQIGVSDFAAFGNRAGQRESDPIENGLLAQFDHFLG